MKFHDQYIISPEQYNEHGNDYDRTIDAALPLAEQRKQLRRHEALVLTPKAFPPGAAVSMTWFSHFRNQDTHDQLAFVQYITETGRIVLSFGRTFTLDIRTHNRQPVYLLRPTSDENGHFRVKCVIPVTA